MIVLDGSMSTRSPACVLLLGRTMKAGSWLPLGQDVNKKLNKIDHLKELELLY